jgi:uncharacterized protein YraI
MHKLIFGIMSSIALASLGACVKPEASLARDYKVAGVEADDMLKLRAGPGTGFRVIAGLPNGTVLRLTSCEQTGGTRWCKAYMQDGNRLSGYVSWAYLKAV